MAFAKNSRYAKTPTVEVKLADGRTVTAVKLRRIPRADADSEAYAVRDGDRLDLLAHRQLGDATAHWRIADANSEVDGAALVAELGREIDLPKS
ncbi:MAG: LysM domain-containing protein [Myxococcales bacterium]|nr:LysM domain-containing protein [Myxococcales bacterium]